MAGGKWPVLATGVAGARWGSISFTARSHRKTCLKTLCSHPWMCSYAPLSTKAHGAPVVLHPPGKHASMERIESFAEKVASTLQQVHKVRMVAQGRAARLQAFRALVVSPVDAFLELSLQEASAGIPGASAGGSGNSDEAHTVTFRTQFIAWTEELLDDDDDRDLKTASAAAETSTILRLPRAEGGEDSPKDAPLNIAKWLAFQLRDSSTLSLRAPVQRLEAIDSMVASVSMLPKVEGIVPPLCTIRIAGSAEEDEPEDIILDLHRRAEKPSGDLPVDPPRSNNYDDTVSFRTYVYDKLKSGNVILMRLTGPGSAAKGMTPLAAVRDRTAEFMISWGGFETGPARCLKLRCRQGRTWEDFNRIDFKKSVVLHLSAGDEWQRLAERIGKELVRKVAVSLHVPFDRAESKLVWEALKAIASVHMSVLAPEFTVTPSFGTRTLQQHPPDHAGSGETEEKVKLIRFYIERLHY